VTYYVDEQLPVSLALWLRERGLEAAHIRELGLKSSSDLEISLRVGAEGGVILTKDSDFLDIRLRQPNFQIVWIRVGNIATPRLLARLEAVWTEVAASLSDGDAVVEVR